VAVSEIEPAVASSCTPVITGVTSSREAATTTWAMEPENVPAGTTPVDSPIAGRLGYSATGIDSSVNFALPALTSTRLSCVETSTGMPGRRLAMSARSLPETSTRPGSSTCASIRTRALTS
jgi:hypothetical protein